MDIGYLFSGTGVSRIKYFLIIFSASGLLSRCKIIILMEEFYYSAKLN